MNVLGMGPMELLLIIVLALIVFGPAKLPEIMAQVGKAIGDFRRATSELSDEFNRTIQSELQEGRSVLSETKAAVGDVHTSVNSAIVGTPAPALVATPAQPPAVMAATNGTSAEPHVEPTTNGSVPAISQPPLADTSQWSWETAAPAPPTVTDAVAEATKPAESPKVSESGLPEHSHERPIDDLLPPY